MDGFVLYEPAYDHETLKEPVLIYVSDGVTEKVEGDKLIAGRLRHWLDSFGDEAAKYGPVHVNLGINARAMLTQHQEFERIRGSINFGWGDSKALARLLYYNIETTSSMAHWDTLILRPTLYLDDTLITKNGVIVCEKRE